MYKRTIIVASMVLAMSWAAMAQGHFSNGSETLNSISGLVRSYDGQPAKDVRIEVRNISTGQIAAGTYTSPTGTFEVANLPAGSYEVHATSGLLETSDRVEIRMGGGYVNMRLPQADGSDVAGGGSISVAEYRVPAKARDLFHKAQKALEKNKVDDTAKFVAKSLEIYPDYADALTLRAVLSLDGNKLADAVKDLDHALKSDPNCGLAYVVLGAANNLSSKFDEAVRSLQRGLAINPGSWQAYFEMGKAFIGKGDYATALRNLERAEQMAPQYAAVHLVKAHAYLALKSYPDAMTELETYLQREPQGSNALQAREALDQVRAFMATKK